ncbi:MAG: TIGR01212 family radical SAM protein [Bacteroidales bacterium]
MTYLWGNNRRFFSFTDYCKRKYGSRIQKVSVNAGFTCPNRDGSKGSGGCSFCNNQGFSPSYCHDDHDIREQIEKGLRFIRKRYKKAKLFIAYFQSYSNTYDTLPILIQRYYEALAHPSVSGISVGTRPDCIDDEKLNFLAELSKKYIVNIEYGVESCYEDTLLRINRGHTFQDSVRAIEQTALRGIHTGIHMIIGLPGESKEQILQQSEIISKLPVNSVKFHQLQIVSDTAMAKDFQSNPGQFYFFEPAEYADLMAEFIARLRPDISIERLAGEVPPGYNLRTSWKGIRSDEMIRLIEQQLAIKDLWQGKYYIK